MPKFKVLVESDKTHVYKIETDDPQEASKIALKRYLSTSEVNDVDEILVIDPDNEWSFGMPIFQVNKFEFSDLLRS